MKKVGLCTCYFKTNYGSMLQAYATQKVLEKNGVRCETISVDALEDFSKGKKKYYKQQILNFKFLAEKSGMAFLKIKRKLIRNELSRNLALRDRCFKSFERSHFKLSESFKSYEELSNLCTERYTDVVVGSDQLWLPVNVVADYYTLNFVPDGINKVAYATSFGISSIPTRYRDLYTKFLSRLNHVSVREENAACMLRDEFGLDVRSICDPTLLLIKEEWLAETDGKRRYEDKYILCYFLGKNREHRRFAERLREKTGYKIVSINHCDEYDRYSDKFADYTPYDVGPAEWIRLIADAEYVCTDSFHGSVFSILNNRTFFTFRRFKSKAVMSTNSRVYSLLRQFGLEDRLFTGDEDIDAVLSHKIDFDTVNKKADELRREGTDFLLGSLTCKPQKMHTVAELEKYECCGCGACANVCPVKAISMKEDPEGFLYPSIDESKCIECSLCLKKCRSATPSPEKKKPQWGYLIQNKDEQVLAQSTSGGAFTAFAKAVLSQGGAVFGVAFDENFVAQHICIETEAELFRFRNSKYVQSRTGTAYAEVKALLLSGRKVLFSGTPCQAEGLLSYLGRSYENLYVADVVCHACPSPLIWDKYKELFDAPLQAAAFRDKTDYGYEYSQMSAQTENGRYHGGVESDAYLRAFFGNLSDRPSCYACRFKKRYRLSDITMWDCFEVHKFCKEMDNNKGVTRALAHSEKGRELIQLAQSDCTVHEVDPDLLCQGVKEMTSSVPINPKRTAFFEDASSMESKEFFDRWFPDGMKVKAQRFGRHALEKLGIYRPVKRFVKKLLGK